MSLFGRKLLFQPQYRWSNFRKTEAGDFTVQIPAGTYRVLITGGGGKVARIRPTGLALGGQAKKILIRLF